MVVISLVGSSLLACRSGNGERLGERVIPLGQPVPKGGGTYITGAAYQVDSVWYQPREDPAYDRVGTASWYGELFHGRRTANGEIYDMDRLSAASPTLPLPVCARVTNLENHRSIIVRVNDRGPYARNRIIDVSTKAAHLLGFYDRGTVPVRVEYVGRAPIEGSDDRILEATLRDHEPAPAPSMLRLASTSIMPSLPPQPPPVAQPRLLGGGLGGGSTASVTPYVPAAAAMSFADRSQGRDEGRDGTAQFLNGRGLY